MKRAIATVVALVAACASLASCRPLRPGGTTAGTLPPPQGDVHAEGVAKAATAGAVPIWKPGTRPPAQGSASKLGAPASGPSAIPGSAPASAGAAPDPSGLSGLPLSGGDGPRDVGAIHVGGGPGLPDGLIGASWDRLIFPSPPLSEEDTGIAVNVRYALEWGGIPVEIEVQHRVAKDPTARPDRYVQRYWIYPSRPLPLAEALAKLPPLGALRRLPDEFGVGALTPGPMRTEPAGRVLLVMARSTSPLATSIGYGYAVPRYGAISYRLLYEFLLDETTAPGPSALVSEIAVDVSYPATDAPPLGSWKDVLLPPS